MDEDDLSGWQMKKNIVAIKTCYGNFRSVYEIKSFFRDAKCFDASRGFKRLRYISWYSVVLSNIRIKTDHKSKSTVLHREQNMSCIVKGDGGESQYYILHVGTQKEDNTWDNAFEYTYM